MQSQTLLQYLTKPNPVLLPTRPLPALDPDAPRSRSRASTTNDKWPIPGRIVPWKDFNTRNLREALGKRLDRALKEKFTGLHNYEHLPVAFLRVSNEDSLTSLLVKSNQSIVLEALLRTSETVLQQRVEMVRGGQAILIYDKNRHSLPDWAGISRVQRPNNILPGETKTSWTFSSARMKEDIEYLNDYDENGDQHSPYSHWPVRQLLYYCLCSHSRYGYIITDQELVAFRVGPNKTCQFQDEPIRRLRNHLSQNAVMEYYCIPWDNYGRPDDGFTINLALWVLHLLAANNGLLQNKPYGLLGKEERILPEDQFILPSVISTSQSDATRSGSSVQSTQPDSHPASGQELHDSQSQVSAVQHSQSGTSVKEPSDMSDADTITDFAADDDELLMSEDISRDNTPPASDPRRDSLRESSPLAGPSAIRSKARAYSSVDGKRKRNAHHFNPLDTTGKEPKPKSPKRGRSSHRRSNTKHTGGN